MTEAAITLLSKNPDGFFLVVEGARIDHALHNNLLKEALRETYELDRAIETAIQMVSKKDSLVMVTADHETGGLALNGYLKHGEDLIGSGRVTFASGPKAKAEPKTVHRWADEAIHTGIDVPLYAYGSGAEKVRGTMENTEIFRLIQSAFSEEKALTSSR